MASINLYKKVAKAQQLNKEGGYKNVILFSPTDAFTAIQVPASTATLGAGVTVGTAHTFPVDEGFISLLSKTHGVTTKGTSVGDDGAQSMEWSFEGIFLGDSAVLQDTYEKMLNDNCVFLVKDQDCLTASNYVQFGDSCVQPTIKLEFTGNTTKEGYKEYKMTGTIRGHRYWYTSTVTEKPTA